VTFYEYPEPLTIALHDPDLLFGWCRTASSWLDALEGERSESIVPVSLARILGQQFQDDLRKGLTFSVDAEALGQPGRCVLLRGIGSRVFGKALVDSFVRIQPPTSAEYLSRSLTRTRISQPKTTIPVACVANTALEPNRVFAQRPFHNLSPLGEWHLQASAALIAQAAKVEDILLDLVFVALPA
jgi:hypothetical protein